MALFSKKTPSLYEVSDLESFRQLFVDAQHSSGDTVAVKFKERSGFHDVTYNELLSTIDAISTGICCQPCKSGHIAVLSPNNFKSLSIYLAVLCSDKTLVPLDWELPFVEIINILNHSDCDTVFFDSAYTELFLENKKQLPKLKNYICLQMKEHEEHDGICSYDRLVEKGQTALAAGEEAFLSLLPGEKDDRLIFYKNGSSDSLRGIVFSDIALRKAIISFLQMVPLSERCLSVLPFDRPTDFICGILASFHSHSTVCLNNSLKSFQKDLKEYKPSYTFLPPLYVENIWQKVVHTLEKQGRTDTFKTLVKTSNAMRKVGLDKRKSFFSAIHETLGGNLSRIYVGGAPLNPEAARFFEDIGITVFPFYSVSECASAISVNREKLNDFSSAGLPLPCMQIKLDDPDEEGAGEICVRGDTMMTGYYKNDRATANLVELSGWFHTGDIGKLNNMGQLYITGRLKNEIVLKSGRSVLPEEIESYLLALPFVKAAKVYANKDSEGAERTLAADITLEEEYFENTNTSGRVALVKEKIDRLNKTLPACKRIHSVHIQK